MKNVLVVSGHTNLDDSVANSTILEEIKRLIPNAEIDCLDKLYPDYRIDTKAEQKKLLWADVIVLQYPVFWYHFPSIMEKWMEESFAHGFSHGSTGDKLKGKKLVVSLTTGAPEELYHRDCIMGYEIEDFLPAIKATCNLCQMEFSGYIYTGGVSYQSRTDESAQIKEKAFDHASRLAKLVEGL